MFSKAVLTNLFIYLFIYFIISVCSQLGDLGPTNRSLLFLNVFFTFTHILLVRGTHVKIIIDSISCLLLLFF